MPFFKGYVLTDGKKAVEKFKNVNDLKSLEEVKDSKSYGGVLKDNAILIDIDTEKEAEILLEIVKSEKLKCRVYQTKRGKHFLFWNNKVDKNSQGKKLAIGIKADIKVGLRNSYEILKKDGAERSIEYDTGDYEELPQFLLPINPKVNFDKLKVGRNDTFFKYILTLQSHGLTKTETRRTIKLVNNFILPEPLDESELNTILRDEAFEKTIFYIDGKFSYNKFAQFLISEHNIKRIDNMLHIYKDGYYQTGQIEIERAMKQHLPELKKRERSELLAELDCLVKFNTPHSPSNLIIFKNGILDINTDELLPFSPDVIVTNKINFNYNPRAYHALTDEILNNVAVNNKEIRLLIEEMTGYTLFRRNELRKMFILTGGKQNGKSTFLNMLKKMHGEENHSVLDIKKLGDRFSTIMLVNKLANIGDDISDEFIADSSTIKKIVTGDSLDAEQKGQPKFQFKPYCKLIFSANKIPKIGKGADREALLSRICIIPFKAKFNKSNPNFKPFIADDLQTDEAIEYLIKVGIDGLKRVLNNKEFTESKLIEEETKSYERENNPILDYFDAFKTIDFINESVAEKYQEYQSYCFAEGIEPLTRNVFGKEVANYFKLKTKVVRVNKEIKRVFYENN